MGGGFLFPIFFPLRWPRGKERNMPSGSLGEQPLNRSCSCLRLRGGGPGVMPGRGSCAESRPPAPRRPHPAPPRAKENSRLLGDTGRGAGSRRAPQPPSRLAASEAGVLFLFWDGQEGSREGFCRVLPHFSLVERKLPVSAPIWVMRKNVCTPSARKIPS